VQPGEMILVHEMCVCSVLDEALQPCLQLCSGIWTALEGWLCGMGTCATPFLSETLASDTYRTGLLW
jgi:hypothetical protein